MVGFSGGNASPESQRNTQILDVAFLVLALERAVQMIKLALSALAVHLQSI
jgi:hypothetical protein